MRTLIYLILSGYVGTFGVARAADVCVAVRIVGYPGNIESESNRIRQKDALESLVAELPMVFKAFQYAPLPDNRTDPDVACTRLAFVFCFNDSSWRVRVVTTAKGLKDPEFGKKVCFGAPPAEWMVEEVYAGVVFLNAKPEGQTPAYWADGAKRALSKLKERYPEERAFEFYEQIPLGHDAKIQCKDPPSFDTCIGVLPLTFGERRALALSEFGFSASARQGARRYHGVARGTCGHYRGEELDLAIGLTGELNAAGGASRGENKVIFPWDKSTFWLFRFNPTRLDLTECPIEEVRRPTADEGPNPPGGDED